MDDLPRAHHTQVRHCPSGCHIEVHLMDEDDCVFAIASFAQADALELATDLIAIVEKVTGQRAVGRA